MTISQDVYLFIMKYAIGIKNSNGFSTTLANPLFANLNGNIFVMNFNNGNIYHIFDTKEEFIKRINKRQKDNKLAIYYNKNIKFTLEELEKFSTSNILMIDQIKKNSLVRSEMRRLSPPASFIGDFVPGYVETFSHSFFDKIPVNIIVLGFEDGLIYNLFNSKEELFNEISTRKSRMKLNMYYKNIEFTKSEREYYWNANVWLTDQTIKDKVSGSWNETMKLVYM
jgi:hypothetical protein